MSGIYIKGLGMPTECYGLRLIIYPNGQVLIPKSTYWEEPNGVEAIPVPEHGRLIDANKLMQELKPHAAVMEDYVDVTWDEVWRMECADINTAPTIIPEDVAKDINVPTKAADKERSNAAID